MKKKYFKRWRRMVRNAIAFVAVMLTIQPQDDTVIIREVPGLVRFEDGSKVVLDEGAKLIWNAGTYGKGTREVILIGKAFFDVEPDPCRPFIVRSQQVTTRVLGTSFVVDAPPGKNEITVTVSTGKVNVSHGRHANDITPDHQIAVNTRDHIFTRQHVNADTALTWLHKHLVFCRTPLGEAMQGVAKKFNVTVVFADEDLKKEIFSASFDADESLRVVLDQIEVVNPHISITVEKGSVTVRRKR